MWDVLETSSLIISKQVGAIDLLSTNAYPKLNSGSHTQDLGEMFGRMQIRELSE